MYVNELNSLSRTPSIKTLQLNLLDMKNAFKLLENILFIISWKIFCIFEENMIKIIAGKIWKQDVEQKGQVLRIQ